MTRNKLYLILTLALVAGYCWAAWAILQQDIEHTTFTPCLFKNVTSLPCPACGTTRSVSEIVKGNFIKATIINPLGLIVAAFMAIAPFWIIFDVTTKRDTLFNGFLTLETTLKIRWVAITLISLIAINWVWNIYKGL